MIIQKGDKVRVVFGGGIETILEPNDKRTAADLENAITTRGVWYNPHIKTFTNFANYIIVEVE